MTLVSGKFKRKVVFVPNFDEMDPSDQYWADEELKRSNDTLAAADDLGDADDEGPGDDLDPELAELALPDDADIILDHDDLQEVADDDS